MTITVKYLASLAEELSKTHETIDASPTHRMTVKDIWAQLNPDTPMKNNTICAINHQYAKPDDEVEDHTELAFFPPVTGG